MSDALTTKDRIKDRLTITADTFDDLIDTMILAISKRISQMCGRRFTQATFTNELHDGSDFHGTRRVQLIVKNAPIQSISSVQYNAGTNVSPNWLSYTADDYDVDMDAGILFIKGALPRGKQNIRITYVGGFSGHQIGITNYWSFNVTPTGTVDGSNRTFTLPEDANEIIVYADGIRTLSSNITFTEGSDTFTLAVGYAPFSAISVDYEREADSADSENWLPADLVEVAEKAVIRTFKKREAEGRSSETFSESSTVWDKDVFTPEDLATIKNYRRGYYL